MVDTNLLFLRIQQYEGSHKRIRKTTFCNRNAVYTLKVTVPVHYGRPVFDVYKVHNLRIDHIKRIFMSLNHDPVPDL